MFLKAFLVFSCLVLYTASMPTLKGNKYKKGIYAVGIIIPKINCSNSFIQKINFTRTNNLCTTCQEMFCQISKALNDSSCTEFHMPPLLENLHDMQGNATCTLVNNGVKTNMKDFLEKLTEYLTSFKTECLTK